MKIYTAPADSSGAPLSEASLQPPGAYGKFFATLAAVTHKLEKWTEDYREYIRFQCEVLPYAYKYHGTKFHEHDFPTFEEFREKMGTLYDYRNLFFATDYFLVGGVVKRTFSNRLYSDPEPGTLYRISYAWFHGVMWNKRVENFEPKYFIKNGHDAY